MTTLQAGSTLINFSLPGVDGKSYTLTEFGDKNALAVIFTCNHCPYALAWEGRLIQLQADYAGKGVQFVAICANNAETHPGDSFPNMQQHAKESGFNFPYLHDESQEVARAYGAERTPEIFLFDSSGALRYHGTIDDNYENPDAVQDHYFRDALDAVLAGESPAIIETAPVGCTIKWK